MPKQPPLTFQEQANDLIQRGLIATQDELETFLQQVSYKRLMVYLKPYEVGGQGRYKGGTTFQFIRGLYAFDEQLRMLTFRAISKVEIAILRARLANQFIREYQLYGWNRGIAKMPPKHLNAINQAINQNLSKEKNIDFPAPRREGGQYPFDLVAEVINFSHLSLIYKHVEFNVSAPIANQFNLHSETLSSWLHSLSVVRNLCAHHRRLWNRVLPVKPKLPQSRYITEFHRPAKIDNTHYFVVLAILKYLLDRIDKENALVDDFDALLSKYPEVPIENMGIPRDWRSYPLFRK